MLDQHSFGVIVAHASLQSPFCIQTIALSRDKTLEPNVFEAKDRQLKWQNQNQSPI